MTPVLSLPVIPINYGGRGLILHVRNQFQALDGRIDMEKAWQPCLQQANNASIMENFAVCEHITALEVERANEIIIWLCVICRSNLTDISGSRIPWERLNGESRGQTHAH